MQTTYTHTHLHWMQMDSKFVLEVYFEIVRISYPFVHESLTVVSALSPFYHDTIDV